MREKLKNELEKWWEMMKYEQILRLVKVMVTILVIFAILTVLSKNFSIWFMLFGLDGIILIVILFMACVKEREKCDQEKIEKDCLKIHQILLNGKDQEVGFKENVEKLDEKVIFFLDMLKFFQEQSHAKIYASFEPSSKTLTLKAKTNEEEMVFDSIPYEIFLAYFMESLKKKKKSFRKNKVKTLTINVGVFLCNFTRKDFIFKDNY